MRTIRLLMLVILLCGCALTTATFTPTPTNAPATAVVPTAVVPTGVVPTAVDTPAADAGGTITLPEHPEQLAWLAAGQPFLGRTYEETLLLARSGLNYTLIRPAGAETVASGTLTIPNLITLSPNLSMALARSEEGTLDVFDLSGGLLYTLDQANLSSAKFSSDGQFVLAFGQDERAIYVYEAAAGERITTLTGFESAAPVYGGELAPGGSTAYWIARATLQLQDVQSGAMGVRLEYQDFIAAAAFAPDGASLAVSVEDKLLLYAVPSGAEQAQITRSQPISSLAFSPDGQVLAAGYGADIQLWRADTLAPVITLAGLNTFTGLVSFSPDGAYLAAVHDGGVVTIHAVHAIM